jgi:tRNA(His) guanylyltransferase
VIKYNTCFWALVNDKESPHQEVEAERILKDTDSAAKHELLFTKYNINYNNLPEMYRKGSVIFRAEKSAEKSTKAGETILRKKMVPTIEHLDIISDKFWNDNPSILS